MKKYLFIFFAIYSCNAFAYYNETIPNQCGIVGNKMYAIFTPNVHTCSAGYFLPANVDGCRSCPNGYTCSGGTFSFNERQSQGIVYKTTIRENIPYACAKNMPHDMVAIFNPNTININWSDTDIADVVANNAGSVVYDSDIRTPVRVAHKKGKVFVGWKFSNPNK
jgi:hypothetical protein